MKQMCDSVCVKHISILCNSKTSDWYQLWITFQLQYVHLCLTSVHIILYFVLRKCHVLVLSLFRKYIDWTDAYDINFWLIFDDVQSDLIYKHCMYSTSLTWGTYKLYHLFDILILHITNNKTNYMLLLWTITLFLETCDSLCYPMGFYISHIILTTHRHSNFILKLGVCSCSCLSIITD